MWKYHSLSDEVYKFYLEDTKRGKDDTIFATASGVVRYERLGKDRTCVRVVVAK